jgi:hypothetical protein
VPDPFAGRHGDLAAGLAAGLAGAAACLAAWAWWRRRRPGARVPLAGLALAAAAAAALAATESLSGVRLGPGRLAGIVIAAAVAAALLADFDRRRWRDGLTLPLLAVTAAGIWATVPDVEAAVVVLGAALPFGLLGWPLVREPPALGPAGALATAALLAWTVVTGGAGRPGSVAGGLACLGVLAVEPVARLLDRGRGGHPPAPARPRGTANLPGPAVLLAAQLLMVGVAARVVGRPASLAVAVPLALGELAVGVAVAVTLPRRRRGTSPSRRSS